MHLGFFYVLNMVVNYTDEGWQIITQRAHGLIAAQICARWKHSLQPDRWLETLIATAEHDDVYNEFDDDNLLNASGGPVNFKMTGFRLEFCQKQLTMALTKSRYIALLIARHIQFVHGKEPAAGEFCQELKQMEKTWLVESGVTTQEIDAAYELLEFCDAFSLLICQGLIQPEQRKIEISNGPDGRCYTFFMDEDAALVVEPWPFEPKAFKVFYESRTISQLSFKDVRSFKKAVDLAGICNHELTLKKKNGK